MVRPSRAVVTVLSRTAPVILRSRPSGSGRALTPDQDSHGRPLDRDRRPALAAWADRRAPVRRPASRHPRGPAGGRAGQRAAGRQLPRGVRRNAGSRRPGLHQHRRRRQHRGRLRPPSRGAARSGPLRGRGADHRHQRPPALAASRAGPRGRPVRGRCPAHPAQSGGVVGTGVRRRRTAGRNRGDRPGSRRRRGLFGPLGEAVCRGGPHLLRPVRGVARRHRGARRPRSPPGRRASGRLRAPGRGALPRGGGHGPSGRAAAPPGCALSRPRPAPAATAPLRVLRAAWVGRP